MKFGLLLLIVFVSNISWSQSLETTYYHSDFIKAFRTDELKDQLLIDKLNSITVRGHQPIGYEKAKDYIFGLLFLEEVGPGKYGVTDVYCERLFTDSDFGRPTFGPMLSPTTGDIMNTEHTWPQSRFSSKYLKETQKADLHHLFPTDSLMNNNRGNLKFGEVAIESSPLKCQSAHLGLSGQNHQVVFEAPERHKGNVARAIFYFSIRYELDLSPDEELYLRQWDKLDPADSREQNQNSQIEKIQGNRNPFVDFPDLVDHIKSFNRRPSY